MKKEKEPLLSTEAETFFERISTNARNLLLTRGEFSPKKRDMILNWGYRKIQYLQIERKYKKIKEKRTIHEKSVEQHKKDPQIKIEPKLKAREITFMRKYEKEYLPKQIIQVDLGFNVGREYGGDHYAVVFRTSKKYSNTVYIVPLTSVKEDRPVFETDHVIGVVKDLNIHRSKDREVSTAAKLMSSLEVSKFRLLESGKVYGELSDTQYQELRQEFFKLFLAEEYKALKPDLPDTLKVPEK